MNETPLGQSVPIPLNKVADINTIHALDFKCYQYALEPEQYKSLINKGTVFSTVANFNGQGVAFALWERGSKKKPAFIHRLGVLIRVVMPDRQVILTRRKGIGTRVLDRIIEDILANKKSESNLTLQMVLSENICLGPSDPDDVTEFMKKSKFLWTKTYSNAFFEYGKPVEGLVFERDLSS